MMLSGVMIYVKFEKNKTVEEMFSEALAEYLAKRKKPKFCVVWLNCPEFKSGEIQVIRDRIVLENHFWFLVTNGDKPHAFAGLSPKIEKG